MSNAIDFFQHYLKIEILYKVKSDSFRHNKIWIKHNLLFSLAPLSYSIKNYLIPLTLWYVP